MAQSSDLETARNLRREWFRRDIEGFCRYYLAEYFDQAIQPFQRDLLLARSGVHEFPRGHGKSTCMFALLVHIAVFGWRKYVVVVSDTYTQAIAFARRVRDELETNERIREDFGYLRGCEWSEKSWQTRGGVKMVAKGAGSAVRGIVHGHRRPDLVVVDDVENDEAVLTTERREKLWKWVTGALWNVAGYKGMDRIVVGTPLHAECLIRRLAKTPGWRHTRRAALQDGQPLWPKAYTQERLDAIKTDIGSLSFAQEYLLEPMDDATRPFRPEWFRYFDDETPRDWLRLVYVDPAIGQRDKSDWFVATVAAVSPVGKPLEVRILEQRSGKFTVAGQLAVIEQLADQHHPYQLGIESNAYQDALRQLSLERFVATRRWVTILPRCNTAPKKVRIFKLSPRVEQGVIRFHEDLRTLTNHMTQYPSVAHDDFEDSLAGVVELAESMGRMGM